MSKRESSSLVYGGLLELDFGVSNVGGCGWVWMWVWMGWGWIAVRGRVHLNLRRLECVHLDLAVTFWDAEEGGESGSQEVKKSSQRSEAQIPRGRNPGGFPKGTLTPQ